MTRQSSEKGGLNKAFRLRQLPPEIRIRIWRYTVILDRPVELKHRKSIMSKTTFLPSRLRSGRLIHQNDDELRNPTVLAVAFTCRELYLEVAPVYYSGNAFRIHLEGLYICRLLYSGLRGIGSRALDNYLDHPGPQMHPFTQAIGPKNAAIIRHYLLDFPDCPDGCPVYRCRWVNSELYAAHTFLIRAQSYLLGKARVAVRFRADIAMILREDQRLVLWTPRGWKILRLEDTAGLKTAVI